MGNEPAHHCAPSRGPGPLNCLGMDFRLYVTQVSCMAAQVDLVAQYGRPAFGLDYYAAAEDLGQLADLMAEGGPAGAAFTPRFRRLTASLCEVGARKARWPPKK